MEKGLVPGMRVEVPFRSKVYTGIVLRVHDKAPSLRDVREILGIPEEDPIVHPLQLELWSWMAKYYMCSMGEVYQAAIPAYFYDGVVDSWPIDDFEPDFQARQAVPTDITIGMIATPLTAQVWTVITRVCMEPGGSSKVVTEKASADRVESAAAAATT